MTYDRRIDRLTPALIVILVDQSESMTEPIAETVGGTLITKAQAVAHQINTLIYELILRCTRTSREPPRAYFFVSVIGYSTDPMGEPVIEPTLPGRSWLASSTELATRPLHVAIRTGANGATIRSPVWVEPVGRGGTPMCAAFNRAGRIAASWVDHHPDTFPPIMLNLSDGEATDGNPLLWADRLRRLSTSDGQALLFNLNLSATRGSTILFPSDARGLADGYAENLFHMSSPLPPGMIEIGRARGLAIRQGARGFAFNADINALASFLNVGTTIAQVGQ
jgi:hypothetical protein